MQDAEESQPPNRWFVTLLIVSLAQALGTGGISLVYPFLPLYIQTLRDAHFISPELLAAWLLARRHWSLQLRCPFGVASPISTDARKWSCARCLAPRW